MAWTVESVIVGGALAAILLAATAVDQRTRRIPNVLSLGGAALGLMSAAALLGWPGMGAAALGWLTGLALFLPLYAMGGMGAGDVKLLAASGSFLGPLGAIDAALWTGVAGGVLALVAMIVSDGGRETLGRYVYGLRHLLTAGVWLGKRRDTAASDSVRFPYALAIALGAAGAVRLPLLGEGSLLVTRAAG